MTEARKQPSFRLGAIVIAASYVLTWHAAFAYWNWDELIQTPREFLRDYAHNAGWMLLPFVGSLHDGDPVFAQLCAGAVGVAVSIVVIVYLAWKRPGEND